MTTHFFAAKRRRGTTCAALFAAVSTSAFAALPTPTAPTRVALTGTAAPNGGNYAGFSAPALNASGQIEFWANLTGGSSTNGIFAGAPGALQTVALSGTAAPSGGNYSSFSSTSNPVLNASGQTAFLFNLAGGSSTHGIFAGAPAAVQTVALQGTAAPSGGNYNTLFTPVFNASGQTAFSANLTGGSATSGIFAGAPGAVQMVALQGTAAPSGGNYSGFSTTSGPVLNASGQIEFWANLTGGSSTNGIFAGAPGAVQTVALQGTAAASGGNYSTFSSGPVLNASGQTAFLASLTGGSSTSGIFGGAPGSVQTVALKGTAAPSGGNYNAFFNPVLNASGQTAFAANLTGGSATSGIFAGAPGAVQTVALQGTAAPGGGNFSSFNSPVLNASGQLAFIATLTGVAAGDDTGLYVGVPGDVVKIVREGDTVDVDPTAAVDNRIVSTFSFATSPSGGQDGRGLSFNDSGLITYKLFFFDGSSGIFTSAVPEPASLSLLGIAGLAMLRRPKRPIRQ